MIVAGDNEDGLRRDDSATGLASHRRLYLHSASRFSLLGVGIPAPKSCLPLRLGALRTSHAGAARAQMEDAISSRIPHSTHVRRSLIGSRLRPASCVLRSPMTVTVPRDFPCGTFPETRHSSMMVDSFT